MELIDPAVAAVAIGRLWRQEAPNASDFLDSPCLSAGYRAGIRRVREIAPEFDAPFFQAGLAGYSDGAMRLIAREHGCPYCVTEALLDRMILGGGHGFDKADLLLLADNIPEGIADHPIAGQIIGSDPDEMAAAAIKMIEQGRRRASEYRALAYTESPTAGTDPRLRDFAAETQARSERTGPQVTFEAIDVNLACPVKKIRNKGRGGFWLSDPSGAIDILKAVRDAVPRTTPCTVKLRRGSDDSDRAERNFEIIFNAAYELGYAWTTVHGRTVEQKYIGPSRWTFLRDLAARHPDKIIFGSGDVWTVEDIFRMIAYTGVHAVSVARGCIGNPWIFSQARDMLAGLPPARPTIARQRAVLQRHFDLSVAINGQAAAGRMMRKFGIRFSTHHPNGDLVRERMIAVESPHDWHKVLSDFYCEQEATLATR